MKTSAVRSYLSTDSGLLITGLCVLVLSVTFLKWSASLADKRDTAFDEYRLDLTLAENQSGHEQLYRQMLAAGSRPGGERLDQNEWIRETQAMIRSRGLQVREVTPVREDTRRGMTTKLFVVMEGGVNNWVEYLHGLASSGSLTYIESFSASLVRENTEVVRIEMVLAQY